ncbi:hypothetical protein CIB95_09160 [Lottiidibacillus patelloidae]|uniref:Uncharacterized protein n=1 Tax=Lottiidibacillus patelloidae TaxID=2670334 RepID=A0A263BTN8_9BACI|nr:hypothetical protein CIB95_09160 [Lottiidibacillus patelloidae]
MHSVSPPILFPLIIVLSYFKKHAKGQGRKGYTLITLLYSKVKNKKSAQLRFKLKWADNIGYLIILLHFR